MSLLANLVSQRKEEKMQIEEQQLKVWTQNPVYCEKEVKAIEVVSFPFVEANMHPTLQSKVRKDVTRVSFGTDRVINLTNRAEDDDEGVSFQGRISRDDKLVMEMRVPFTVQDIIEKPMDQFNDLLARVDITEEQINLCRDIRRRGKNKIAAQNCRKRKLEQICVLETDLSDARTRKEELVKERVELLRLRTEWQEKLERLEEGILGNLGRQGSVLKVNP